MAFLPHREKERAVKAVLENFPEAPCLPVLSRSIRHMLEGLPCLVFDRQNRRVFFDLSPEREGEILQFYDRYEKGDLEAFRTSEEAAPGFYALLERLKSDRPQELRWIAFQAAGPLLLGDIVKQADGVSSFFHETLRDILIKAVNMKARWMERKIKHEVPGVDVIAGLPETTLVSFTSASGAGTRESVINAINDGFRGLSGPAWVHCCANIDWSLLTEADVDVINFDAYQHAEKAALYHRDFKAFLEKGGMIAWGIVPVTDEAIGRETLTSLVERLKKAIDAFSTKGIDEAALAAASWIMPCCDANLMSVENAERAFALTRAVSENMRREYGFGTGT
jgi:hypothetical protein